MSKKRRSSDMLPQLSPRADAAILRLARLLVRQIARELNEEQKEREKRAQKPSEASDPLSEPGERDCKHLLPI